MTKYLTYIISYFSRVRTFIEVTCGKFLPPLHPVHPSPRKGYKHLTPESLARELAFSNRTKNGAGLDQVPLPPPPSESGTSVGPLSKKRKCTSSEMSKLEEGAAAAAVDSPELRALCRVYGARATEVVSTWKKVEQDR